MSMSLAIKKDALQSARLMVGWWSDFVQLRFAAVRTRFRPLLYGPYRDVLLIGDSFGHKGARARSNQSVKGVEA
jgi:hypothetical protein